MVAILIYLIIYEYIIMPIEEYRQGTSRFNNAVIEIQRNCSTLCRNSVDDEYVKGSLKKCHFLYVNKLLYRIIGFATVINEPDELYIDVICNADFESFLKDIYCTFFKIATGKDIIAKIIDKAKSLRKKKVQLRALTPVISYYYRLGFDFLTGSERLKTDRVQAVKTDRVHAVRIAIQALNKKEDEISDKVYKKQSPSADDTRELQNLEKNVKKQLSILHKYYTSGQYTEQKISERYTVKVPVQKMVEDTIDDGFPMIYNIEPITSRSRSKSDSEIDDMGMTPSCSVMGGTRRKIRRRRRTMKR
jgi:hypothetical protein